MYYPSLFNNADQLLDTFFGASVANQSWSPKVDVINNKDHVELQVELAGVKKEDISINAENGVLTISASKSNKEESKEKEYYLSERRFGSFKRSFRLSSDLDADSIDAKHENGVLHITVQRKQAALAKKIEVK